MDRRATDRRRDAINDPYAFNIEAALATLCRRKTLFTGLMLIILIPGILFVVTKPSKYTAHSAIILEEQAFNPSDFRDVIPGGRFDEMSVNTQTNLLTSPKLISQTIDKLEKESGATSDVPRDKAIANFVSKMMVSSSTKSRVIDLSFTSKDPAQAANIVNTHMDTLVDYQIASKKQQIGVINEWLVEQIEALKKDSQEKSKAMQEFRLESGIVLGKNSQELIDQQISDLIEQLVPIETHKLSLQAKAEAIKGAGGKEGIPDVLESEVIRELKSQASQARQDLKALGAQYGVNHPDYQAAQKRVNQVNADLGRETDNIKNSATLDLQAVTQQEEMIRERIEELNRETDQLRDKEITLQTLEAEQEANRKLLSNYLERHEEVKSQMDFSRPDIRIIAKAEAPTQSASMSKIILLILIGAFSVAFALGATLLLELVDRGIEEPDDIKRVLNLKLIGVLPKSRNPIIEATNGNRGSYIEELKRVYLALSSRQGAQSILITAARSGEGKSTVALSLARYLSSIGVKVILVDVNTTSPSVAVLSGTNQSPGFAELMNGAVDSAKSIHKDEKGLAVIPAGNQQAHVVDLLASDRLARTLATLKSQYDFVILDCSPVLSTTDAEVIAGQVDQVVLIVERARTAKKHLKKAAETLRQYAKDTPAVILNKSA